MSTMTEPQEQAFDAAVYDLPIPAQDGHKADKLVISFSGSVELDRTNADDLDLVESLRLGREVTMRVSGPVTRKGFGLSGGKDDAPETTTYGVSVKVQSLEVVSA